MELSEVTLVERKMEDGRVQEELLYNADPDCDHEIVELDSGVKCVKCTGWFCY